MKTKNLMDSTKILVELTNKVSKVVEFCISKKINCVLYSSGNEHLNQEKTSFELT